MAETRNSARTANEARQPAPAAIQISNEQLTALLCAVQMAAHEAPLSSGTMLQCPAKFYGTRDITVVENFTTHVELYRRVEGTTEADALLSLSLLFSGDTHTWWRGISSSINSWQSALDKITDQSRIVFIAVYGKAEGERDNRGHFGR